MPTRFSNQQLILLLEKAARIVSSDLCLMGTDQITVDASGCVDNPVSDPQIEALVLMQTECLISQRDFSLELSAGTIGTLVKDGEQVMDTTKRAGARDSFFNSPYSPCAQYEKRLALVKLCRLDNKDSAGGGRLIW
ncbi:MAG: hypothetical protein ACXABY_02320 [Candidatus Thorarchaeota archaeon]|jgi:hypothetical protein